MSDRLVLGIDVGTTSVKAALINTQGSIVDLFIESYTTNRGDAGIVEQNPDDWMVLIDKALQGFVASGKSASIAAAGLCSQVNTHVFVDADGKPLMPAILWQDGRASAEAAELNSLVSDEKKCEWWGAPMPIDASHVLSRMLWVLRHRPAIWEKTRWVMLPKDYCLYKLTGQVVSDPLSNIGLVNQALNYIPAVFDLVPGSADRAVPLAPVTQIIGELLDDHPLAGVAMVSGTMDAWAGLVGTGGARAGSSVYLSGTSEILGISSSAIVPTPGVIVFPSCSSIQMHAAPTQSGGDAKQWFASVGKLSPQQMSELVAATPGTTATPLFLPQLEGERAPLWNTDLRAAFLGMSRRTDLGDLARAIYEGVALSARHALETLQVSADTISDYATCGGGGFRSSSWNQIRADVLGMELRTLAAKEPGVLGAATIAAIGTGIYGGYEQAHEALARIEKIYYPTPSAHSRYNELFDIYKDAIDSHAGLTHRLSRLGAAKNTTR